jgi:aspartyl/glutamyl-tRNA(Asn/Gln) amidotransferase C subunit
MTPEKITPELFEKLVELAQFALDPSEKEYLRQELNHQLAAVKELSEIPLDPDVSPTTHGLEVEGASPRQDTWAGFPNPKAIVALAPECEEGMIVVPDVALARKAAK